jgi:hypothetical protein
MLKLVTNSSAGLGFDLIENQSVGIAKVDE